MSVQRNLDKNVLIGGAWPYANGSIHLGHIAALLPGDIIARYYRLTGAKVLYVSGSDCHGTPISVKAASEGVEPVVISQKYHNEFKQTFDKLGFSYDMYAATTDILHQNIVQQLFIKLLNNNLLYSKTLKMAYCTKCNRFLPDRYVSGTCYNCNSPSARGDQCDECNTLIDIEKLTDRKCALCGFIPEIRETNHLFIKLSEFQKQLEKLVNKHSTNWRQNAVSLTQRYLKEGIQDRAITRDLDWGINSPIKGFEDKKIYVWFEAVLGYLTTSMQWANAKNPEITLDSISASIDNFNNADLWTQFWNENTISYYIHGKDNIPFHTLILPGLLMGLGIKSLPTYIVSSEYLTIEGKKLSTSRNWAIWAEDFLRKYDPDPLRYFLIMNGPEKGDSDFSWNEFLERNNGELLGAYGNLVNRILTLSIKGFGKVVPTPSQCTENDMIILENCKTLYARIGDLIEKAELREALRKTFDTVRAVNKYVDTEAPWSALNTDKPRAATILKVCMDLIVNLSNVCYPFIPFVAKKALSFVNLEPRWEYTELKAGYPINEPSLLVKRLDKSIVTEEIALLGR